MNETQQNTCTLVKAATTVRGKQGLDYSVGISAQSVGAQHIHMQLLTLPPGGKSKVHKHQAHETAIYALSGATGCWYGEQLQHHAVVEAGDFFYIPAGVPHAPYNMSTRVGASSIISRTDPNEQESVTLMPELDPLFQEKIARRLTPSMLD